jgi:hypothetical protein
VARSLESRWRPAWSSSPTLKRPWRPHVTLRNRYRIRKQRAMSCLFVKGQREATAGNGPGRRHCFVGAPVVVVSVSLATPGQTDRKRGDAGWSEWARDRNPP